MVQERIEELKQLRSSIPEFAFQHRKENLLVQLHRLLPGTSPGIHAVRDTESGNVVQEHSKMGEILTAFWQKTFNAKPTNATLRKKWLDKYRSSLNVSLDQVRPTLADVEEVLDQLPKSACGPDGVPFQVYKSKAKI